MCGTKQLECAYRLARQRKPFQGPVGGRAGVATPFSQTRPYPQSAQEAVGEADYIVGELQGLPTQELISQIVDRSFFQALKQK